MFYVIRIPNPKDSYNAKYDFNPTVPHASIEAAKKEAERLAKAYPGAEFLVVKPVVGYKVETLVETIYSK